MSWALSSVIPHYVLTTHLTSQATHQGMLKQKGKEQEIPSEALGMEKCRPSPSQTMMLIVTLLLLLRLLAKSWRPGNSVLIPKLHFNRKM